MTRKLIPGVLPLLSVAASDFVDGQRSLVEMPFLSPDWPAAVRAVSGVGSSYAPAVKSLNPVSYWRLGEASGTVAVDEMGANPGTYVGAPTLGVAGALVGDANTAVTLNGTTQYAYCATPSLDMTTAVGISAWVKSTAPASGRVIGHRGIGGSLLTGYEFSIGADGTLSFFVGDGTNYSVPATGPLPALIDGGWHHVVACRSGSAVTIYVDGNTVFDNAVYASAVGSMSSGGVLHFGIGVLYDWTSGPAAFFPGSIDEPAIWNRALTPAEVLGLYAAGAH